MALKLVVRLVDWATWDRRLAGGRFVAGWDVMTEFEEAFMPMEHDPSIAGRHKPVPTTNLDLMDPVLVHDPWPAMRALRELGPVLWHESLSRWLVTSERATRTVLTQYTRFTVQDTIVSELFGRDAFIAVDDRAQHDALRNVWSDAFRPRGLAALRPWVENMVGDLWAPLAGRLQAGERVDLVAGYCRTIPTLVIAQLMGVPEDALPDIVRWSDALAASTDTYARPEAQLRARALRQEAQAALAQFILVLIGERRKCPGEDLISALIQSPPGRALPDELLMQNIRQLLFAGNETTAKWLAQIFVVYGEQPDVRRRLCKDPGLIRNANEEVLRWQAVVGTVVRRVTGGPIQLEGIELADGDGITCVLAAANRDPARHKEPDRFEMQRELHSQLGFGVGLHHCLGAMLARMEAEIAVKTLLATTPDYEIAAPYTYGSLSMRGPLPVVIEACV